MEPIKALQNIYHKLSFEGKLSDDLNQMLQENMEYLKYIDQQNYMPVTTKVMRPNPLDKIDNLDSFMGVSLV